MPPKTEDLVLLSPSNRDDYDDSNSLSSSPCSSTMSVASPFSNAKKEDCCFTFVELQQPTLSDTSGKDVAQAFERSLGFLNLRVNDLTRSLEAVKSVQRQDEEEGCCSSSPVLKACTMSLDTRVPLLLKQASLLIGQLQKASASADDDDSAVIIGRLRSNFALVRVVQYLDLMEEAMKNPPREMLDERLLQILQSSPARGHVEDDEEDSFFRVSPWQTNSLAFDLPIGPSASTELGGEMPLQVEVEPIFEIHAADIVAGKQENLSFSACSVVIESCKHKATPFSAGAGTIGECIIRVHLTPLEQKKQSGSLPTWGEEEPEKLTIKEARAVQTNAYPPKPQANVDLYTSNLYGDAGITVTMIVKTCVTEQQDEIPKLHLELFMAPSSSR